MNNKVKQCLYVTIFTITYLIKVIDIYLKPINLILRTIIKL